MTKTKIKTRTTSDEATPLGRELAEALEAVRDDQSGKKALAERVVEVPESVDVKAIRGGLGMSQSRFAVAFGFEEAAVRNWEQGRRAPEKAARILLTVIAHDPDAVREALLVRAVKTGSRRQTKARTAK